MSKLAILSDPNPEFLRRAIALATSNVESGNGGPFAAVIVRQGKVVGEFRPTGFLPTFLNDFIVMGLVKQGEAYL